MNTPSFFCTLGETPHCATIANQFQGVSLIIAIICFATSLVLLLIALTYRKRIAELERVEESLSQLGRIGGLNGHRNVEEIK